MKTIKLIIWFLTLIITGSCSKHYDTGCYEHTYNRVLLSIQDTSGNDLIKGIGWSWHQSDVIPEEEACCGIVNNDEYVLSTIYPNQPELDALEEWRRLQIMRGLIVHDNRNLSESGNDRLGINLINGLYYIVFTQATVSKNLNGKIIRPVDRIIRKLTCPSIFNDELEHEIVAVLSSTVRNYQSFRSLMERRQPLYYINV